MSTIPVTSCDGLYLAMPDVPGQAPNSRGSTDVICSKSCWVLLPLALRRHPERHTTLASMFSTLYLPASLPRKHLTDID